MLLRASELGLATFGMNIDNAALNVALLAAAMTQAMPAAMVPSAFVSHDAFPLLRNGKVVSESCIAARGSIAGGDELVDAIHKASAVATDVLSSLPEARTAAQHFALYGKIDGFPVRTRELAGGQAESEDLVTSIERHALPAGEFAIPKGFTQTTMGGYDD